MYEIEHGIPIPPPSRPEPYLNEAVQTFNQMGVGDSFIVVGKHYIGSIRSYLTRSHTHFNYKLVTRKLGTSERYRLWKVRRDR